MYLYTVEGKMKKSILFLVYPKLIMIILLVSFFSAGYSFADTIHLKNGDVLSGTIKKETNNYYLLNTAAMSQVKIIKEYVDTVSYEKDSIKEKNKKAEASSVDKSEKLWSRTISLGYNESRGNSEKSKLTGKLLANRKTGRNELNFKAEGVYTSSEDRMDTQKYNGYVRYAYSFGKDLKWYNFYKLFGEHDKFSDLDYRLIPSAGYGYWFFTKDEFKLLAEGGLGYEMTKYYEAGDKGDITSVFRGFVSKKIFSGATISQDFYIYPSLGELGEYMLYSETSLDSPITDKLSLVISLIDEYDSSAPSTVKKNNLRVTSSLAYKF